MRLPWKSHLAESDLVGTAYGAGQGALPEKQRAHLDGCSSCQEKLAGHIRVAGLLARPWRAVPVAQREPVSVRIGWLQPLAAVALVGVAALTLRAMAIPPDGSGVSPSAPIAASSPVPASASASSPYCSEGPQVGISSPSIAASGVRERPAALQTVNWSPDGSHILLAGGGVDLLDRSGRAILRIPAAEAATWIDAQTFATGSNCESGSGVGRVTIHSLTAQTHTLTGTYETTEMLGSGHGALALAPRSVGSDEAISTIVWKSGQFSPALQGTPLAWSPDGSRLLLATGVPKSTGGVGSPSFSNVSLLDYPSRAVVTTFGQFALDPSYQPVISPDGRKIAVACGLSSSGACAQYVLDADTGEGVEIAAQPAGIPLSWLRNGHVLLAAPNYGAVGPLQEWNGNKLVASEYPPGSWGAASSAGFLAEATKPFGEGGATRIIDPSGTQLMELPAAVAIHWSPDGRAFMLDSRQQLTLVDLG